MEASGEVLAIASMKPFKDDAAIGCVGHDLDVGSAPFEIVIAAGLEFVV